MERLAGLDSASASTGQRPTPPRNPDLLAACSQPVLVVGFRLTEHVTIARTLATPRRRTPPRNPGVASLQNIRQNGPAAGHRGHACRGINARPSASGQVVPIVPMGPIVPIPRLLSLAGWFNRARISDCAADSGRPNAGKGQTEVRATSGLPAPEDDRRRVYASCFARPGSRGAFVIAARLARERQRCDQTRADHKRCCERACSARSVSSRAG